MNQQEKIMDRHNRELNSCKSCDDCFEDQTIDFTQFPVSISSSWNKTSVKRQLVIQIPEYFVEQV